MRVGQSQHEEGRLLDRAADAEAADAFRAALALAPAPAERLFLERRLAALGA